MVVSQSDIHLGLSTMIQLLEKLGNPQEKLDVIHVAGTNGKGSHIAMMKAVLREAGYRVGVYTSPAVFNLLEVICVDEAMITQSEYETGMEYLQKLTSVEQGWSGRQPSPFEKETALAFTYFQKKRCDIVLLETGMGGDLDATNVVSGPLCCVLTSISMDHGNFLGNTLEEVAQKKAGIMKPLSPVVTGVQDGCVMQVIEQVSRKLQSPLITSSKDRLSNVTPLCNGTSFDYVTKSHTEYVHITVPLQGTFQVENAINVLEVLDIIKDKFENIKPESVKAGLGKVKWEGRLEQIGSNPDIYLDGAHNPGAAKVLRQFLIEKKGKSDSKRQADSTSNRHHVSKKQMEGTLNGQEQFVMIVGMFQDKDYEQVIDIMLDCGDMWITVTPPGPRGLAADILADVIRKKGGYAVVAENVEEAVKLALESATGQQTAEHRSIIAFGSLSYLSQAKSIFCDFVS